MNETTYKTMKHGGAVNIALGIVTIVFGVTVGVLGIISGAKLLKKKSEIMF